MTTDSILILLGVALFIFSLIHEKVKFMNTELPALTTKSKIYTRILATILLLVGLASYYHTVTKDEVSQNRLQKIRLTNSNIKKLFLSKGIEEIKEFPVTPEITAAFYDGYTNYQSRLCRKSINNIVIVPQSFARCPYGDTSEKPFLGPSFDLTIFSK